MFWTSGMTEMIPEQNNSNKKIKSPTATYLEDIPQVTRRFPCTSKSDNTLLTASNTCSFRMALASYKVTWTNTGDRQY